MNYLFGKNIMSYHVIISSFHVKSMAFLSLMDYFYVFLGFYDSVQINSRILIVKGLPVLLS